MKNNSYGGSMAGKKFLKLSYNLVVFFSKTPSTAFISDSFKSK